MYKVDINVSSICPTSGHLPEAVTEQPGARASEE